MYISGVKGLNIIRRPFLERPGNFSGPKANSKSNLLNGNSSQLTNRSIFLL